MQIQIFLHFGHENCTIQFKWYFNPNMFTAVEMKEVTKMQDVSKTQEGSKTLKHILECFK